MDPKSEGYAKFESLCGVEIRGKVSKNYKAHYIQRIENGVPVETIAEFTDKQQAIDKILELRVSDPSNSVEYGLQLRG